MLANRLFCGYLGIQSGTLRYAATQKYIPDEMRARINGLQSIYYLAFETFLSLFVGFLGDRMDYRVVMSVCALLCVITCLFTIVRRRKEVSHIYTGAEE